jgi:hypothetical protein
VTRTLERELPGAAAKGSIPELPALPFERTVRALRSDGLPRAPTTAGDWPRTTRVLPWMLAAFIAVLWVVPFNSIGLTVSLPIDLHFDRLVLPIIAGTWLLTIAVGGERGAAAACHRNPYGCRDLRGRLLPERGVRCSLPEPDA